MDGSTGRAYANVGMDCYAGNVCHININLLILDVQIEV